MQLKEVELHYLNAEDFYAIFLEGIMKNETITSLTLSIEPLLKF